MILGAVGSVYVCVSTGVCMFKTRSGGSLWQCVYVGGCVCQAVWVCVF